MVIKSTLLHPVSCSNCPLAILRAFASPSGLFGRLAPLPRHNTPRTRAFAFRRNIVTSQSWRSHLIVQRGTQQVMPGEEDARDENPIAHQGETYASASSTPWYLQVETPQRISNPLLQRQRIPELPPDPPPLLEPMLEHISINLGLDDLTIFDLRTIDPPPALGANLLMILGTARSEKHLHVSADRFCRWLKVTHKLSPYADGLLGRGELKLKLRRKARRARLLSNVGSSETSNADDGIRTGWICVNIGTIEDGRHLVEDSAGQEGYVGFGSEAGGAKVVVQMLTQEKRDELDLEDLWGKMMRRHERKESRISRIQGDPSRDQEVGQSSLPGELTVSNSRSFLSASLPKPPVLNLNQIRLYHCRPSSSPADINAICIQSEGSETSGTPRTAEQLGKAPTRPGTNTDSGNQEDILPRNSANLATLSAHVDYLRSMPFDQAMEALGIGAHDGLSTPFLKSFYRTCLQAPLGDVLNHRIALICYGIYIGHSGYTKLHLFETFDELQSFSLKIPKEVLLGMFAAFLTPNPVKATQEGRPSLTKESLFGAIVVLDAMSSRGHNIQTEDIREMFQKAVKQVF